VTTAAAGHRKDHLTACRVTGSVRIGGGKQRHGSVRHATRKPSHSKLVIVELLNC
jgi:hypothetical protein